MATKFFTTASGAFGQTDGDLPPGAKEIDAKEYRRMLSPLRGASAPREDLGAAGVLRALAASMSNLLTDEQRASIGMVKAVGKQYFISSDKGYANAKAERWFASSADAEAAGFRR